MHQVDLNTRRQKQQSKFHTSSRFCQGTFPNDECSLQLLTKCFRCPSSNSSKLPPNVTAWGNVRGSSREGRHFFPQDSPLRTSWSIPWALSRHSYEESHQQKSYWIYCYRSWILFAKSRRRKFSQKDKKGGCFYHFTLNHEQWALAGWGGSCSLQESQAWKGSMFWAQRFSVPCSSEDQQSRASVLRHWLVLHWNLVEWAGTTPALPLPSQTLLSNPRNSTKSITKSFRNTTPKLTLLCTEPAQGNLRERRLLEIKSMLQFCTQTPALKRWIQSKGIQESSDNRQDTEGSFLTHPSFGRVRSGCIPRGVHGFGSICKKFQFGQTSECRILL